MSKFQIHTLESAPDGSKNGLKNAQAAFGMIPNLIGVLANSPSTLKAYQQLHQLATETSFTPEELTVVWQTINVEHNCHYCVPAHTAIAHSMKVSEKVIDALRDESELPTEKLEALRAFTLEVVRERGVVANASFEKFLSVGFTNQNVLEVVSILSQKVISNYVNHLAETPLDVPFQKFNWTKKGQTAAV